MRLTRTTVSSGEIGSHRVEKPRRSVNMTLHRHGTACLRPMCSMLRGPKFREKARHISHEGLDWRRRAAKKKAFPWTRLAGLVAENPRNGCETRYRHTRRQERTTVSPRSSFVPPTAFRSSCTSISGLSTASLDRADLELGVTVLEGTRPATIVDLRTETDRHVDTLRTSVTYSCGG
jgi:hypothetical protein